jgi:hypothetical protein
MAYLVNSAADDSSCRGATINANRDASDILLVERTYSSRHDRASCLRAGQVPEAMYGMRALARAGTNSL